MTDPKDDYRKNIAETLVEALPKATVLSTLEDPAGCKGLHIATIALPKNTELKEVRIDLEALLPNPRKTSAVAQFNNTDSFLKYVARHATEGSVVWCNFDPQAFSLSFTAVIDEHEKGLAGWRAHKASFTPAFSAEWKAWKSKNASSMAQAAFAEWIQEHDDDIATANGLPTSLQMLEMATNFVMNEERSLKSAIKLQSGGVRMTYIADADTGTTEDMKVFERFALGIPVFHGGTAWSLGARLKYRNNAGKVSFHYELIRPDRVHEGAAKELIEQVSAGLAGVPMLMGACS